MFTTLSKKTTTTQKTKEMLVRLEAIAKTCPFLIEDTLLCNWLERRNFVTFLLSFQTKDLTRDQGHRLELIYKNDAFTEHQIAQKSRQEWETQKHDVSIIRMTCREQQWNSLIDFGP